MFARGGPGYTTIVSGAGVFAGGIGSMARLQKLGALGAGVVLAMAISGCGGPPPSKIAKGQAVRTGMKSLEVVPIPRADRTLAEAVKAGAVVQAGFETVRIQTADPAPGGQAEAVREAARRKPPALIVEAPAAPDAELDKAVAEARGQGLLVVSLGRPLAADAPGPGRGITVGAAPFGPSAKRLVELAMRNAGNGKLDPKAGALVVVRPDADPLAGDRIAALKEALRAAGVATVDEVALGDDPTASAATVAEAVKAHPAVTLVLASDGPALSAADLATGIVKDARPYVVAGFTDNESYAKSQTPTGEYAAAGVYAHDRLFRKGVNVAARALRGDKTADRVDVDTPLLESPRFSALPHARYEPTGGKRSFEAE